MAQHKLATVCCLLLVRSSLARTQAAAESDKGVYSRRMLRDEAADVKRSPLLPVSGRAGPATDWLIHCEGGRSRCPNLFLASWAFQCASVDGTSCCMQPDGQFCVPLDRWADEATPDSWQGQGMPHVKDGSADASSTAASPAVEAGTAGVYAYVQERQARTVEEKTAQQEPQQQHQGEEQQQQLDGQGQQEREQQEREQQEQEQERERERERGKRERERQEQEEQGGDGRGKGGSRSGGDGGRWHKAAATYYSSYPDCCHDSTADQTECRDYNACKWEGYFKAFDEQKPKSWVKEHNIVAVFETPNSQNRKEWDRKWKRKKLRLRNPVDGSTLEVQVIDTCDDSDCDGCCTRNAARGGGMLIDLEYFTAKRFWGGHIRGMSEIEWQEA